MGPAIALRLRQHLTLTPQVQQALRLLQMSALEFAQEMEQALSSNPFLEENTETPADPASTPISSKTEEIVLPPRRTRFIDTMNAAMRAGRKVGFADTPVLEKDTVLRRAREYTGLDDYGEDRWFEQPLEALLEAIRSEAQLNPASAISASTERRR